MIIGSIAHNITINIFFIPVRFFKLLHHKHFISSLCSIVNTSLLVKGYRVQKTGYRALLAGYRIQGKDNRILRTEYGIQGRGNRI